MAHIPYTHVHGDVVHRGTVHMGEVHGSIAHGVRIRCAWGEQWTWGTVHMRGVGHGRMVRMGGQCTGISHGTVRMGGQHTGGMAYGGISLQ